MGLFSTILGAVAGPIAGLFGKKSSGSQKQVVENRVDYKRMVRDAEAAGFNPLTALRNGGSAGFSTQTTTHPALSSQSVGGGIADALATGVSAWAQYDPMQEKRADLEYQLVQAQLDAVQKSNRQVRRSFDVPTNTGTSARSSSGGFSNSVPVARSNPGGTIAGQVDPWTGTLLSPYMQIHPGLPSADSLSGKYGEIVEMIGGVAVLGGDLAYSGYKLANRKGNVDKAVQEAKDTWRDGTKGYRSAVKQYGMSNEWAKSQIPKRDRPYYPDMQDFNRGRGPY